MGIDPFLARALPEIEARIEEAPDEPQRWVVTEDDVGVASAEVDQAYPAVHDVLASLIKTGAYGVAHVDYEPDKEVATLHIVVSRPMDNSDTRTAKVSRGPGGLRIGAWESSF